MKIVIVGAGAMGSLYGGKLSAVESNEVFLLDGWADHVAALQANGLKMEENGVEITYDRVKATGDPAEVGVVDLAVIFVKSTMTEAAVRDNAAVFGPDTMVLTLQNGLGNIDILVDALGEDKVIAGTTAHGATMLGPGKMRHAGSGATVIGQLNGEISDRLKAIAAVLEEAGMETQMSENALGLVWDKLLANVGINALTAVTGLQNGQILDFADSKELMEQAVREGAAVAAAEGVKLNIADPVAHCADVAEATRINRSSMLQDVTTGRKTEIDMINGAIVRRGKALGVPTPVNEVLTKLVRVLEQKDK